jgi:hypothetical protein
VNEREVIERVKARFAEDSSIVERDVLAYLADLRQKGLLED